MDWLIYLVAGVFCLLGALCVASIIFSLPGTWIMLGMALIIEVCDGLYLSAEKPQTFGWRLLGIGAGLGALGELIEFVAGAAGAKRGGATRRGVIGALIGGVLGAILLTGLLPIPLIGSLVGAVIGTFMGAVVGEISGQQPKTVSGSLKPAIGATLGRLAGTMAKLAIAIAVWIALSAAAFV
jgi:hypothetical protein